MPSYILSRRNAAAASGQDCCCDDNSIDRNSAIFFNNLATKLLDMSRAIEQRVKDLVEQARCNTGDGKGVYIASIETPVMSLGIKYEYVEYVKRYGPPPKGKFDTTILNQLRVELGISTENNL